MKIISDVSALPTKIQNVIKEEIGDNFIAGVKTTFKPNATIPILWLVIYELGLLFCNTHKTRSVFKNCNKEDIDSVKLSGAVLTVLFKDITEDDFVVTLDQRTDMNAMKSILKENGYQIL